MKRILIAWLMVLWFAVFAYGQGQSILIHSRDLIIQSEHRFGANILTPPSLAQRVLTTNQGVHGLSTEESEIRPDGTVIGGAAFVTSSGYPNSGAIGPVESITLNGGQTINHAAQEADVADAIEISSYRAAVRNTRVTGWKGTGVKLAVSTGSLLLASPLITGCMIDECHTGISLGSSDQIITGNTIMSCRIGLYGPSSAGQIQCSDNHYYGHASQTAGVYDGKCAVVEGNAYSFTNETFEASHFGVYSTGNYGRYTGCRFQRMNKSSIYLGGTVNHLVNCSIEVAKGTDNAEFDDVYGVHFNGVRNDMLSGEIEISDEEVSSPGTQGASTQTGLRVSKSACVVMHTLFQDYLAPSGKARGIHIDAAVQGFRADVRIYGFDQAGDAALDIDLNTIKGVNVTLRGNSNDTDSFPVTPDATTAAQYVDIPAGWDSTNSIAIINEANGASFELVVGTAY